MKKGVIKGSILLTVFLISMVGFSLLFNREKTENVRDFGAPTLPVAYIGIGDVSTNRMYGYQQKMDGTTMRDSLTPLNTGRELTFQINPHGRKINSVTYEVTTADQSELIENAKIKSLEENGSLKQASFCLETPILMDQEYLLCFAVDIEGMEEPVNYYTRIVQRSGIYVDTYLEFVRNFYEKCLNKETASDLTAYIEPDDTASNSSFNTVTIHSSFDQISWGTLEPTLVQQAVPILKEINETTTSISQEYIISAKDTEGNTEYYSVTEFYRMRYAQSRVMLLDFERSATQIFDAELPVLTSTGINLGVVGRDVQYLSNQSADIAAFVIDGDLWSYNRSANKCTKIFGFRDGTDCEERREHSEHDIKIVRVSETGDISFVVYGYMNADTHEGTVGSAVCQYYAKRNIVEEKLFIPSNSSYQYLKQNLSVLSYVSTNDQLYLYVEGNLYQVDLSAGSYKLVKDSISPECFVVSRSQASVAWMDEMDPYSATHITAMSLESGEILQVTAQEGQKIRALGFINEDLVYGIADDADIRNDVTGTVTFAMNCLCIRNFAGEIIKEYQQDGIYITDVTIQEGLMEMTRVTKEADTFVAAADDHIMNNRMDKDETVSTKLVTTKRKGGQITLVFTKSGKTKNLLALETKIVDHETVRTLSIEVPRQEIEEYYVYGKGQLLSVETQAGEAIRIADENMGVVLNRRQNYVWERGNRLSTKKINVEKIPERLHTAPLDESTIKEVLGEEYTVMNLTGCTLSSVLYQISNGYPVAAKNAGGGSELIVGYDQYNVWIYDVSSQTLIPKGMKDSTAEYEAAGNVFMSYQKK